MAKRRAPKAAKKPGGGGKAGARAAAKAANRGMAAIRAATGTVDVGDFRGGNTGGVRNRPGGGKGKPR